MTDQNYLTAICAFGFFGPARIKLLLSYFKKPKKIWLAKSEELLTMGLPKHKVYEFERFKSVFDIDSYFKKLEKFSIKAVTILDKNYPENLKGIPDAPIALYVRGDIKTSDSNAVAIVGTRMMTSYGREVARRFASELAGYGITIISGLALGIDSEAQRAALNSGGRTVAILASGLDMITPVTNKALALEFIKNRGAIVSEYPIGHIPQPYDFPVRDRLISGFSKAVIVIEGRMKSGTFYTVKAALDQGRPVFAVPGPITSPASEGPNYLIQNGAKLITGVKDVLDELDLQVKVDRGVMEKIMPTDKYEAKFMGVLDKEPLHLDEVVRITGIKTDIVSARLTLMEMKGLVKNLGGGMYRKI